MLFWWNQILVSKVLYKHEVEKIIGVQYTA